jgi:hypothetical protein
MPTANGVVDVALISSSLNYEVFLNGISKGAQTASYAAGTDHRIGALNESNSSLARFGGRIYEIIAYAEAHDATKRAQVLDYLVSKYAHR